MTRRAELDKLRSDRLALIEEYREARAILIGHKVWMSAEEAREREAAKQKRDSDLKIEKRRRMAAHEKLVKEAMAAKESLRSARKNKIADELHEKLTAVMGNLRQNHPDAYAESAEICRKIQAEKGVE